MGFLRELVTGYLQLGVLQPTARPVLKVTREQLVARS